MEKKTWEEIADWAAALINVHDEERILYRPENERARIWDAILYLTGVDLLAGLEDSPNHYLHSNDNFKDYFKKELR